MKPIDLKLRMMLVLLIAGGIILLNGCASTDFDPTTTVTATPFPPHKEIYPTYAAQPLATPRPMYRFEQGTYLLEGSLVMLEPEQGEILTSLRPRLRVEPVPEAVGYEFQIDVSPEFDSHVKQSSFISYNSQPLVVHAEPEWTPYANLNLTPDLFRTNEWGALSRNQIYEIILRLIDSSTDRSEALTQLYVYVAFQINMADDAYTIPCDIALARVGNECGNQVEVLGYMAYLLGYPVRKLAMRASEDWIAKGYTGAGHTTLEVFVEGQWQVMDPYVSFTAPGVSLVDIVNYPVETGYIIYGRDGLDDLTYPRLVAGTGRLYYLPYLISVYSIEPDWHASPTFEFASYEAVPESFYDSAGLGAIIDEYEAQPTSWTPELQNEIQENLAALWHPRQVPEPAQREPFKQTYYWRVRAVMNPQVMNVRQQYVIRAEDVTAWSGVRTFTLQVTIPVLE